MFLEYTKHTAAPGLGTCRPFCQEHFTLSTHTAYFFQMSAWYCLVDGVFSNLLHKIAAHPISPIPLSPSLCFTFLHGTWVCAKSIHSCLTLCDVMYYSLPGSFVHGILQAGILEWVAVPSSRGSSPPRDPTHISCICCIAGGFFTTEPLGKQSL